MADNSWKNLELWDRVKWARSRRFPSAVAAAAAFGMKDGTYRCYERGPGSAKFIPLEYKHAKQFAREFKVRWEWLLDGTGEPWLSKQDAEPEEEGEREPPNHIREWREHAGLSVAELAKKSGLGVQTINALESGEMDTSGKLLRALADAIGTTQGNLLDHNPEDVDPTIFQTVKAIPKERRVQALEILKTFRPYQRLR
jgi:transcriptional regulator with XRE-family HTH domain